MWVTQHTQRQDQSIGREAEATAEVIPASWRISLSKRGKLRPEKEMLALHCARQGIEEFFSNGRKLLLQVQEW